MRLGVIFLFLATSSATLGQTHRIMEAEIQADTAESKLRFDYVDHVKPNDTLCANAIIRAARDAKDSLYFVIGFGAFGPSLRYEQELSELSKKWGLKYGIELYSDLFFESQTQGCYKDYMDKRLSEKFGKNFKVNLHIEADSLFLVNHLKDTISSSDCDKRPTFRNKKLEAGGISVNINLPVKERREEWVSGGRKMFAVYRPFMDIQFAIDKDGNVSTFQLADFYPANEENKHQKEQLFELAIDEIRNKYSKWEPAEINGVKMNAFYTLRVEFKHAD